MKPADKEVTFRTGPQWSVPVFSGEEEARRCAEEKKGGEGVSALRREGGAGYLGERELDGQDKVSSRCSCEARAPEGSVTISRWTASSSQWDYMGATRVKDWGFF